MSRLFHKLPDVDLPDGQLDSPLPLGPEGLQHGSLANGIKYYVRQCAKPKGRAALCLAVKVGSAVEQDHAQGVAHIVEHLAFNATEQYSSHEIVKFLERIGAQFGACQNAYTSADETCYQLLVPTELPAGSAAAAAAVAAAADNNNSNGSNGNNLDPDCSLLKDALAVMAQFAFHIRCADSDLSRERGAVLEEWRMSRDASGRSQEAHWRLIMQGSRYADRLPIGKENIVRTVTADTVKAFYERWYRPENMAVVVVGDVPSTETVVQLVRDAFESGHSRDPSPCQPIPSFDHVPHETPRYSVFVDREAQSPTVMISCKHARRRMATPADYLEYLTNWMFCEVLNTRLFKLSREQEPPLLSGSVSEESLTRTTQSDVLTAVALEGGSLVALEALITEVARIRLHGITAKEFSHALADIRSEIENQYKERDQSYSVDIRDEYVRHFLYGEFVTGQEFEARLSKTLLHHVTQEAVEKVAARFHPSQSCVIKVVEHRTTLTEASLAATVQRVLEAEAQGTIPPWSSDAVLPDQLLPASLAPLVPEQAIVSERKHELLGATEWTLSNGMTITFKETDFMTDEVLMTGTATGGLSEVPRSAHYTAACAGLVAGQLGTFGIKPALLNDFLAGTRIDMTTSEGAYSRSFKSVQSPEDLEVAFQLVHLLFNTHIQVDEKELRVVVRMLYDNIAAQQRNPLTHYHNRVRAVNYSDCYYFRPMTKEDIAKVDLRGACNHHNRSYHNPAEFKVVLTGNVSRDMLQPLVLKYLATIAARLDPPPKPLLEVTPLTWSPPSQPVVEDVHVSMVSPITQAQVTFPVVLDKDKGREDVVWLSIICHLLETRLLQRMRFEYGEIYTVSVTSFFGCEAVSNKGNPRGDVAIGFTCDPANRQHLVEMALQEVEAIQNGAVTADELETVIKLEKLQLAELEEENTYWHDNMVNGYQSKSYANTGDLDTVYNRTITARDKVYREATPQGLKDNMCRLLPYPARRCYTALAMVPHQPGGGWRAGVQALIPRSRRAWLLLGVSAVVMAAAGCGVALLSSKRKHHSHSSDNSSGGSAGNTSRKQLGS